MRETDEVERFATLVRRGLAVLPKTLPSRYLYDETGSRLFAAICDTEEYYLTRAETEILERRGADIAAHAPSEPLTVVDVGAGDGRKTALLVTALAARGIDLRVVPIDVSPTALASFADTMHRQAPDV